MKDQYFKLVSRDGMEGPLTKAWCDYAPEIKTHLRSPLCGVMSHELGVEDGPMLSSRTYRFKRRYTVEVYEYEETP